jgi:MarR family 2-MHQ and catechol resistance regulon transcriptional repressor
MDTDIKLMVVFSKLSYQFMNRLSKDLEKRGMSASTYAILAHLNNVEKSKTQSLGEVAVITRGTITHVVNKLEKSGYVYKSKDVTDKRITWVEITNKGKHAFNQVNQPHIKYLKELLSIFDEQEKQQFINQIKYFGKTLEKRGIINEN